MKTRLRLAEVTILCGLTPLCIMLRTFKNDNILSIYIQNIIYTVNSTNVISLFQHVCLNKYLYLLADVQVGIM